MLDSTTVEFGWDPPLPSDDVNIRGVLKGYQVDSLSRLDSVGEGPIVRLDRNVSIG